VDFYNTTDSEEVMATGLRVFPCGMRVANFMLLSDSPLQLDAQRWMNVLTHYNIDGQPVFDLSQESQRKRLNEVLALPDTLDRKVRGFYTLESADHIRARTTQTLIITDDNMGPSGRVAIPARSLVGRCRSKA
jgi:hypothetical protein